MYNYTLSVSRRSGESMNGKPRFVFWFRTEQMQCSEAEMREIGAALKKLGDVLVIVTKTPTMCHLEEL